MFDSIFQSVEFQANTSTAKYIMTTSNIPVINLATVNVHISCSIVLLVKDLLLKTHSLFVIKANATAIIHAIIVEGTFGMLAIL